jgi:hypothetical protein
MRFRVENPLIQANKVRLAKDKIEVLECFAHPETLHTVLLFNMLGRHNIFDCRVGEVCLSMVVDTLEHVPGYILILRIAGDSISVENAFNCFGP